MKNSFSINYLSDKTYFSSSKGCKMLIFHNVNEYEDEVLNMLENNINFMDLDNIVNSWGGEVEMVLLDNLIKTYLRSKQKENM